MAVTSELNRVVGAFGSSADEEEKRETLVTAVLNNCENIRLADTAKVGFEEGQGVLKANGNNETQREASKAISISLSARFSSNFKHHRVGAGRTPQTQNDSTS